MNSKSTGDCLFKSATTCIEVSLVIPCYNEERVIPLLTSRLATTMVTLGLSWEVIFVDDGSADSTLESLKAINAAEPRFKIVALSRNFGQQVAISAGLAYASGEVVGILDADLQDPPELVGTCLTKLKEGYDVVYAIRRERKEGTLKKVSYFLFYRLLARLAERNVPLDAGDFCLMRRRVVEALKRMPERNIFLRGLRAWSGFRQAGVEYERPARAAGKTKYSMLRLIRLAADGVFSFSTVPLRISIYLGLATVVFSAGWGLLHIAWRVLGFRLMGHTASQLPGWTTLAAGMFFFGGIQLLLLGCIGEYIGRIYTEVKQRPRWLESEIIGLPHPSEPQVRPGPTAAEEVISK